MRVNIYPWAGVWFATGRLGVCVTIIGKSSVVAAISIQVKSPGPVISRAFGRHDHDAMIIRIVSTVPISIRSPGIVPVIGVIITVIIAVAIIIPVVQFTPSGAVLHLHMQVAIVIVFITAVIFLFLLFLCTHIFILRSHRGEIYIVRSLTGFVSRGAIA